MSLVDVVAMQEEDLVVARIGVDEAEQGVDVVRGASSVWMKLPAEWSIIPVRPRRSFLARAWVSSRVRSSVDSGSTAELR